MGSKSYSDVAQDVLAKAKGKAKSKDLPPGVTDKAAWKKAEEIVRKQHGTTDGKWGLVRHIYDQMTGHARREKATKSYVAVAREVLAKAGGPYIGPKGGKWADPQHTVPWKESEGRIGPRKRQLVLQGFLAEDIDHALSERGMKHPRGITLEIRDTLRDMGRSEWAKDAERHAGWLSDEKQKFYSRIDFTKVKEKPPLPPKVLAQHRRKLESWRMRARDVAKGFQLLAREAMAKSGAYVGYPQQGVPFSGPFSPLVPSNMAGPAASPVGPDDLPDNAFLVVDEGGRRDVSGRTSPRAKRRYQARDANGMFDPTLLKACVKKAKADGYGAVVRKAIDILKRIGGREA